MKKILAMVFTALLICLCTGCSNSPKKEEISLALVWGIRANQPIPSATSVQQTLEDACESFGSITIVINDGTPHTLFSQDIENPGNLTSYALQEIKNNQISQLSNLLNNSCAVNAEVDTLEAIKLCVRELNSLNEDQSISKEISVFDNGLSTTGYLDFTSQDLLHKDPQQIVAYLREQQALPSLSGIHVDWYFIGDCVQSQDKMSDMEKNNLRAIWQEIINESGGNVSFKENTPSTAQWKGNLPGVKTVSTMQIYDSTQIGFKKNSSTFANKRAAMAILKELAEEMKATPNRQKLVVGTTATYGSQKSSEKLSLERANTVKNALVQLGVTKDQIITIGLGFANDPWHNPDLDKSGQLIEEQAEKNRRIIVIDANSEKAKELLN